MDIFLLIVTVPVFLMLLSTAFGNGADSPSWELRWRGLEPPERDRIADADSADAESDDPEEAELVAGLNRPRRRRSAYVEASFAFIVVATTVLSLAGLSHGFSGWGIAIAGIGGGLWAWVGEKRLNTPSRVVAVPDARL